MYISSSFFFKSQIQGHSFRELFLGYTTKILPIALYHLTPSISFIVHIAPRKLIIYLLIVSPSIYTPCSRTYHSSSLSFHHVYRVPRQHLGQRRHTLPEWVMPNSNSKPEGRGQDSDRASVLYVGAWCKNTEGDFWTRGPRPQNVWAVEKRSDNRWLGCPPGGLDTCRVQCGELGASSWRLVCWALPESAG